MGMKSGIFAFALAFMCAFTGTGLAAGNRVNQDLLEAKHILQRSIYNNPEHRRTFYCGAPYERSKKIQLPAGFRTPDHHDRQDRMEWEHIVPVYKFGVTFYQWNHGDPVCREGSRHFRGRRCAEASSERFRYIQADMYNLVPAIGAVNAVRGNKEFEEFRHDGQPSFGVCPMQVRGERVEPPSQVKGFIARVYLYMEDAYPREVRLSNREKALMTEWNEQYPVDAWECERAKQIEKIQKNENRFVKNMCIDMGLWEGMARDAAGKKPVFFMPER